MLKSVAYSEIVTEMIILTCMISRGLCVCRGGIPTASANGRLRCRRLWRCGLGSRASTRFQSFVPCVLRFRVVSTSALALPGSALAAAGEAIFAGNTFGTS